MLTGIGGDEFLTGSFLHCADMIKRGKFFAAHKQAKAYQQIYSSISHPLLSYGVFPLLKPILSENLLQFIRIIRRDKKESSSFAPLALEFTERVKLRERLRKSEPRRLITLHRHIYQMLQSGWLPFRFEMEARDSALFQLEYRFPLHDRRMGEFCMALPESQRCHGTQTKLILRQAMRKLLPESIRLRSNKAEFSHVFTQIYENLPSEVLASSLSLANPGWVDGEQIRIMYKAGKKYPLWQSWMLFGIEIWLRELLSHKNNLTKLKTLYYNPAGLQPA